MVMDCDKGKEVESICNMRLKQRFGEGESAKEEKMGGTNWFWQNFGELKQSFRDCAIGVVFSLIQTSRVGVDESLCDWARFG